MDCGLPGSSIHGIFQARVLEWAQEYSYSDTFDSYSLWKNHTLWLKATLGADRADGDGFAKLIILINGIKYVKTNLSFFSNTMSLMEKIAEI